LYYIFAADNKFVLYKCNVIIGVCESVDWDESNM